MKRSEAARECWDKISDIPDFQYNDVAPPRLIEDAMKAREKPLVEMLKRSRALCNEELEVALPPNRIRYQQWRQDVEALLKEYE